MAKKAEEIRERRKLIAEYVSEKGEVRSSDIRNFLQAKKRPASNMTLARDLNDLLNNKKIVLFGAGRSVKYRVNPIHKEIDVGDYFNRDYLHRAVKERFDFDVFKLLEEEVFTGGEKKKLRELHSAFLENLSRYKSKTLVDKEFERLLIEFSWKSSQIEGNTYSLLETEVLIKSNEAGEGKTKEETRMILNHKFAFDEIMKNKDRFLNLSLGSLERVHSLLIQGLHVPKNVRKSPIRITQTKYRPLDNEHQIREALEKMIALVNGKDDFFEKAFLSLVLLSYIQAFEDGNKRVARMMANAVLLAHNSIPISYRTVKQAEYIKASLLFYETSNLSYFKEIFLEQFEFAVKNYF